MRIHREVWPLRVILVKAARSWPCVSLGIRPPSSSDDPGRRARLQAHELLGTWAQVYALYFTAQPVRQTASFPAMTGQVALLGQAG